MKKYEIHLESIAPLLMHGSQAIGRDTNNKKKGGSAVVGDPEEWKKTVYFDDLVGAYVPAINFESSLVEAAKQFKVSGKATASKFFKSGIFVESDLIPLTVNGEYVKSLDKIKVDSRSVKNPATKMRQLRYRAIFDKWEAKVKIIVASDDYIDTELLKNVVNYAGMYVGLCDFRPRFGRFQVAKFTEVKE